MSPILSEKSPPRVRGASRRSQAGRLVVISDLHVSAGPLDDCDTDLERALVEFLDHIGSSAGATEIVVNGDFLDFAQAPPWEGPELEGQTTAGDPLCFTEAQSVAKLDAILGAHGAVFAALGRFLASGNSLVIIPGNHDADFFWPRVRQRFASAVNPNGNSESGESLNFHLEQVYRPSAFPHVWVEHGHQHDPCNCFQVGGDLRWSLSEPPILIDATGQSRLLECIGTRFLVQFLNGLDASYPFVDNVKPFSKFLHTFGASAFHPHFGPLRVAATVWAMSRYLARTLSQRRGDLLSQPTKGELDDSQNPARVLVEGLSDSEQELLAARLVRSGFPLNVPLRVYVREPNHGTAFLDAIAAHPVMVADLGTDSEGTLGDAGDSRLLTLRHGYSVDETAELRRAAGRALQYPGVSLVIMGHTHEPIVDDQYLNTGSWTRYYRFDDDERPRPWFLLRTDSYKLFPYELNFAEVRHESGRLQLFRARSK